MNKFQKELLSKCEKVDIFDEIPLLDGLYVIPTNKKHDSGYKIMYIIGVVGKKYYLLDTYCDVIRIESRDVKINDINIDVIDNGIIHYWSNFQKIQSIYRLDSCVFYVVDRIKPIWEED